MSTPNIELPEKSILEIAAFALDFVNDLYRWGKEVYADKEITPTEFNQLFNQVLEPAVANFTNN
ncbi:MAG: hypothetical protein VSS52_012020, partial [Thiotrichaceae bacterium]|nr:hypothetical protein [Thiotrichaceae bacterium]